MNMLPLLYNITLRHGVMYDWLQWGTIPLFIKICIIISLVSVTGTLFAIIHIAINKMMLNKEKDINSEISKELNNLLLATVVNVSPNQDMQGGKPELDVTPFYRMGLSKRTVNKLLIDAMLGYRSNFTGKIAERTRSLYLTLSLHKNAIRRLRNRYWDVKVAALTELYSMDAEVPRHMLLKLVKDKNRCIREVSRLLLMKFTSGDPLQYLKDMNEPLSSWEEFEIFQLFQQRKNYQLSSMEGLISRDSDPTIASLSLKLAVHFEQHTAVPFIRDLVHSLDTKLRIEAVTALGKLQATNAEEQLIRIYPEQPHDVRIAILASVGNMQSGQYLGFLEDEFIQSNDFETKKAACKAIVTLYPRSKKIIERLKENQEPDIARIFNHSINPLIHTS